MKKEVESKNIDQLFSVINWKPVEQKKLLPFGYDVLIRFKDGTIQGGEINKEYTYCDNGDIYEQTMNETEPITHYAIIDEYINKKYKYNEKKEGDFFNKTINPILQEVDGSMEILSPSFENENHVLNFITKKGNAVIYLLFNKYEIVYIGSSTSKNRTHKDKHFTHWTFIEVPERDTQNLLHYESLLINHFNPCLNIRKSIVNND